MKGKNTVNIPGELASVASNGIVTSADGVYDYNQGKFQEDINNETEGRLDGQDAKLNKKLAEIDQKYDEFEDKTDEYFKQESAKNSQKIDDAVKEIAKIPNNEVKVVDQLPDTGVANTIYRVIGETSYAEWAYTDGQWKKLAEHNNGIDDEPTAGSENLVKSDGVSQLLLNNLFVGKGNTINKTTIKGLIPNHTYTLYLENIDWRKNDVTIQDSALFVIQYSKDSILKEIVYVSTDTPNVQKSYTFTTPDSFDYILVGGRANDGEVVRFMITEPEAKFPIVDDSLNPVSNNGISNSAISQHLFNNVFIGNNNNLSSTKIVGIIPNSWYSIRLKSIDWNTNNIPEESAILAIVSVSGENETTLIRAEKRDIKGSYIFHIPNEADYINVSGRATKGETVYFQIEKYDFAEDSSSLFMRFFQKGSITGLSSGNPTYTTNKRDLCTYPGVFIRLKEGDRIYTESDVFTIYGGLFNDDGSYIYTGWVKDVQVEKDCKAMFVIRYNENVSADIDYVTDNIVVLSNNLSITKNIANTNNKLIGSINSINSLKGVRLTSDTFSGAEVPIYITDKNVTGRPLPIILSIFASYIGDKSPSITINVGAYRSIPYTIRNREFQQLRIPPILNNMNAFINISIPEGTTLTFDSISCDLMYLYGKSNTGIRLNSHLGFLKYAPEQTKVAFEASGLMGYDACIVNPIKTKDGVWMCYHENKAYLSIDGTIENRIALSGEEFNQKTYDEIMSYDLITSQELLDIWGTQKVPTLEEFFEICCKMSMRPVFSVHPTPNVEEWNEIKTLLIKYNILNGLTLKLFSISDYKNAYDVFKDSIDSYIVITYITDVEEMSSFADKVVSYIDTKCRVGIELPETTPHTKEIINAIVEKGLYVTANAYRPKSSDFYKEIMSYGASEFTDDCNPNSMLNW